MKSDELTRRLRRLTDKVEIGRGLIELRATVRAELGSAAWPRFVRERLWIKLPTVNNYISAARRADKVESLPELD